MSLGNRFPGNARASMLAYLWRMDKPWRGRTRDLNKTSGPAKRRVFPPLFFGQVHVLIVEERFRKPYADSCKRRRDVRSAEGMPDLEARLR